MDAAGALDAGIARSRGRAARRPGRPGRVAAYGRALAAVLRRRAGPIAGFAVLLFAFDMSRALAAADGVQRPVTYLFDITLNIAAAVASSLVDAANPPARWRMAATVATILALVTVLALTCWLLVGGALSSGVAEGRVYSNEAFVLRMIWTYFAAGLLFAAYCRARDRELAAMHAVRTAELARADAERDIIEMRVHVLQSRVEPALLFGALDDVRRLYVRDADAADALLDDLIAYLRAALPQMRGGTSTLAREAALAEAYLRVLPAGRDRRVVARLSIDDGMRSLLFPAMVLLPLVHAAGASVPEGGVAARLIEISAPAAGQVAHPFSRSLRVDVVDHYLPHVWAEEVIAAIRGNLLQSFGPAATLDVLQVDQAPAVLVTWPAIERPGEHSPSAAQGERIAGRA